MPFDRYPPEMLTSSPSIEAGIPLAVETNNRIFACEILQQAGILLKLPQATICTSQLILHRFYYRKSMIQYRLLRVILTSLFIATKVEETPRRLRDLLLVVDRILKKRFNQPLTAMNPSGRRFSTWRQYLKSTELIILRELGYILYADHPHKFILHIIHQLDPNHRYSPALPQRAWNFLNDSMRTSICLIHPAHVVATACVFLASRILQITFPPVWYHMFDSTLHQLIIIASIISDLYTRDPVIYIPVDEHDAIENELLGNDGVEGNGIETNATALAATTSISTTSSTTITINGVTTDTATTATTSTDNATLKTITSNATHTETVIANGISPNVTSSSTTSTLPSTSTSSVSPQPSPSTSESRRDRKRRSRSRDRSRRSRSREREKRRKRSSSRSRDRERRAKKR